MVNQLVNLILDLRDVYSTGSEFKSKNIDALFYLKENSSKPIIYFPELDFEDDIFSIVENGEKIYVQNEVYDYSLDLITQNDNVLKNTNLKLFLDSLSFYNTSKVGKRKEFDVNLFSGFLLKDYKFVDDKISMKLDEIDHNTLNKYQKMISHSLNLKNNK